MTDRAALSEDERKVIDFLADSHDFYFYSFATIGTETHLARNQVRSACRSLTDKGLARYERNCWTEDGEPAGAGYGATSIGAKCAEPLPDPDGESPRDNEEPK